MSEMTEDVTETATIQIVQDNHTVDASSVSTVDYVDLTSMITDTDKHNTTQPDSALSESSTKPSHALSEPSSEHTYALSESGSKPNPVKPFTIVSISKTVKIPSSSDVSVQRTAATYSVSKKTATPATLGSTTSSTCHISNTSSTNIPESSTALATLSESDKAVYNTSLTTDSVSQPTSPSPGVNSTAASDTSGTITSPDDAPGDDTETGLNSGQVSAVVSRPVAGGVTVEDVNVLNSNEVTDDIKHNDEH